MTETGPRPPAGARFDAPMVVARLRRHLQDGATRRAARLGVRAAGWFPDRGDILSLAVQSLAADGDRAGAIRLGLSAPQMTGYLAAALTDVCLAEGQTDTAAEALDRVTPQGPAEAAALARARHRMFLTREEPSAAEAALREGLEASPDAPDLLADLVRLLEGQHRAGEAAELLSGRSLDDAGRRHLARVLIRSGRYDEAVDHLAAAPKEDVQSGLTLARTLLDLGRVEAARAVLARKALAGAEAATARGKLNAGVRALERDFAGAEAALAPLLTAPQAQPADLADAARYALFRGDVERAWQTHERGLDLARRLGAAGRRQQTVIGQLINEFRLFLRPGDGALWGDAAPDGAARAFRQRLEEEPGNTPAALGLILAAMNGEEQDAGDANDIPARILIPWDGPMTEDLTERFAHNRAMNPGLSVEVLDGPAIEARLRAHGADEVLDALAGVSHPGARTDIIRLALLVHEGGAVLDARCRCHGPLAEALAGRAWVAGTDRFLGLGAGLLAASPGHPISQAALTQALESQRWPTGEVLWLSTGPGAVARAFALAGTDGAGRLLPGVCLLSEAEALGLIAPSLTVPG